MKKIKVSTLAVAAILVSLALPMFIVSAVPVGATEDTSQGGIVASIAVAVELEVNKWPKWTNIPKGATDELADVDNGNPTEFVVLSTTTVPTKIQVKGSDNLQKTSGTYDYIGIENVEMGDDSSGPDEALTTEYSDVTWLTNLPVPSGSDDTYNVYFYLTTRADQTAGTYNGTLYVKLVSLEE